MKQLKIQLKNRGWHLMPIWASDETPNALALEMITDAKWGEIQKELTMDLSTNQTP